MKFDLVKYYIKNPGKVIVPLAGKGLLNWIPDETFIKLAYRGEMGKKLDLENPKSYNEKLQWLKLHDRNPVYHSLVDKYEVKKYISNTVGEQYTVPTLGIWDNPDDIQFDQLPSSFVLKCTHDNGSIVFCLDKSKLDIEGIKAKLRKSLKKSTYWFGREWVYIDVKPRIIAEPYLVDESGIELKDYKVFTFNGVPKMIEVDYGRFTHHRRNIYTCDWEYMDVSINYPSCSKIQIKKPEKLTEMLAFAQKLSDGIPHVRVDFYCIKDKLFVGELTFCHACGYGKIAPEAFDYQMGSWLQLPGK